MGGKLVLELLEGDESIHPAFFSSGREVHSLWGNGELVGVLSQGGGSLVGQELERFGRSLLELCLRRFGNHAVSRLLGGCQMDGERCAGQSVE